MPYSYPLPEDVGVKTPRELRKDRFAQGFQHALRGGHLTRVEYFRLSFRLGYRAAKLYLRDLRRRRGILQFPMRARVKMLSAWD